MALKVTLDTNCFFDYFERAPQHIEELVDLATNGHIELAMTTRVMADTQDKWTGLSTSPIWQKTQSFPELKRIGSAFRLDISRFDMGDYLISESDAKMNDRIGEIMSDAQIEDVDHLFGHIMAGRDIFVTSDSHFLDRQEQLKNELGAIILKPQEAVQEIRKRLQSHEGTGEETG